jgi:hypothetical protein
MRLLLAVAPLVGLLASPAAARNFSCSDQAAEMKGADGRCTLKTSSCSPMALGRNGEPLSIRAYSELRRPHHCLQFGGPRPVA